MISGDDQDSGRSGMKKQGSFDNLHISHEHSKGFKAWK